MNSSSVFLGGYWVVAVHQKQLLQPLSSALEVAEVHYNVLWSLFVNFCWLLLRCGPVFQELAG